MTHSLDRNPSILHGIVDIVNLLPQPVELRNRALGRLVDSLEASPAALGLLAQSGVRARGVVGHNQKHLNSTSFGFVATNMRSEPVKCPSPTFAENFREKARTP